MNVYQQNDKDISKLFTFLRNQLQLKEKELLQLQRADPCLLAPDFDQIDTLLVAIESLQLCTEEGLFVFAGTSISGDIMFPTSTCSTDFNSIKTLPSTSWLSTSKSTKQHNEQRASMLSHLLSLPIEAYLTSSNRPFIGVLNPSLAGINTIPNLQTKVAPSIKPTESILKSHSIYSKEFWLRDI